MTPKVEDYLGLVNAIAVRLAEQLPVTVETDDLIQAGSLGLMDAIEKFDAEKGVAFATYAKFRIRGAMLDSLRELDWETRDGRRTRKKIERVIAALRAELGEEPGPDAIANALGVTVERYKVWEQQIACMGPTVSQSSGKRAGTDEEVEFDAPCREQWFNPQWIAEHAEARAILREVILGLLPRYQQVIEWYYGPEGLTFAEIGQRLGVNESRVSQIHKACIEKLAEMMRERKLYGVEAILS